GQIYQTELLVDRHLGPHAAVAVDRPGVLFPGVIAELTRHRDRTEDPEALPRPHVISLDESFDVVVRRRQGSAVFREGPAHDHDIPRDQWRRMKPDLSLDRIDWISPPDNCRLFEVHQPVF